MTEWVTPRRLTSGVPEFVRRDHSGCRQPTEPRCWEHPMSETDPPGFAAWREGDLWVIDVPGYGITQAESEADIPRMVADLIEQTRAEKIARFDAAPDAEESLRVRVARVIASTDSLAPSYDELVRRRAPKVHNLLAAADAAIAVIRGDDA